MERHLERRQRHLEALGSGRALGSPLQRASVWRERLNRSRDALLQAMRTALQSPKRSLSELHPRLVMQSPLRRLQREHERLTSLVTELGSSARRRLRDSERELGRVAAVLDAHSPVKTLARGYSVVHQEGQKTPLTSVEEGPVRGRERRVKRPGRGV